MAIGYKIIRYCGLCKEKFFVTSQKDPKRYCDKCEKRVAPTDWRKD